MDQAGPSRGRDRDVFIYDQEEYVPYDSQEEDKGKSQVSREKSDVEDDKSSSKKSHANEEGEVEDTDTEDDTDYNQIVPLHTLQDNIQGMLQPLLTNVNSLNEKVAMLTKRSESRSTRSRRSRSSSRFSSSNSYTSRKRTRSPSSSPEKCSKNKRKDYFSEEEEELTFEDDLFEGDEAVGKNISSESKNILKAYFSKKLQRESLQIKLDRHPRPGNTDFLKNPATNVPIWDKLKAADRTLDIKMRKAQSNKIAGTVAAVRVLEKIDNEEQRRNLNNQEKAAIYQ